MNVHTNAICVRLADEYVWSGRLSEVYEARGTVTILPRYVFFSTLGRKVRRWQHAKQGYSSDSA